MKDLQEMTVDECIDHMRRLDILSYRLECKETFKAVYKEKKRITNGSPNEDTCLYEGKLSFTDAMSRIKLLNSVSQVNRWNKTHHNLGDDNRSADNR